ncbi:hypothetical protein HZA75_00285 [Candidatus Roizmanbacteria bacterium]|nr:hypothetical protein [Candidatus Roizmanbacteria bacterium]
MKNKKGQILLITVMLLATVMTIVLSISFKSITETQVTKLEEESQKALAAAESAIDVALKENQNVTIGAGSLSSISGFSGSATVESLTSKTFTTPNVAKDGSYTFYLGDYNLTTKTIGASTNQDITLCFESGSTNPAIEITLVKSSGVKKYVVDPSSRITNASTGSAICTPDSSYGFSYTVPGIDISTDGQLLLVRVLYSSTRLFFSRATDFPIQGRTISSQAVSNSSTGVSKKIVLFQSYPQIPGEFFTTTF